MAIEWGYVAVLSLGAVAALVIARLSWRREGSPASKPLAMLMLSLALWSLLYAFHWLRLPAPSPYFWIDATYIGVVSIPICLLAFALYFTNRATWLTRGRLALLILPQILTLLALWTDSRFHFFFGEVQRSPEVSNIFDGGPVFWLNVIYSYSLVMIALVLLVMAFIQARGIYRQQLGAMLLGMMVPLATNFASVMGYNPTPALDLTPLAFTVTGAFFFFALYRLGLLDVVPIARYTLVEEMSDGVLVLDAQNRIVDLNPAVEGLLDLQGPPPIGRPALELLNPWPEIQERFQEEEVETRQQVTLEGDPDVNLDVRISPLHSRSNILKGRLIIIRDISDRVQIEQELRNANHKLQKQIAEVEKLQARLREQAIRDALTGVFNRRYLEESLVREIAQVERNQAPLSVAMLDIDNFKSFNDTHGHAAGDKMLESLAEILQNNTRAGDIVCRYGGEEFVVVLPGASLESALLRIEYLRQTFGTLTIPHQGLQLKSTLSAGVATYPQHGESVEDLLAAADEAMYRAKQAGRNQVIATN